MSIQTDQNVLDLQQRVLKLETDLYKLACSYDSILEYVKDLQRPKNDRKSTGNH